MRPGIPGRERGYRRGPPPQLALGAEPDVAGGRSRREGEIGTERASQRPAVLDEERDGRRHGPERRPDARAAAGGDPVGGTAAPDPESRAPKTPSRLALEGQQQPLVLSIGFQRRLVSLSGCQPASASPRAFHARNPQGGRPPRPAGSIRAPTDRLDHSKPLRGRRRTLSGLSVVASTLLWLSYANSRSRPPNAGSRACPTRHRCGHGDTRDPAQERTRRESRIGAQQEPACPSHLRDRAWSAGRDWC